MRSVKVGDMFVSSLKNGNNISGMYINHKKNPPKWLEIAKASVLENAQKFMKWTQMTSVLIFIIEKISHLFFFFLDS